MKHLALLFSTIILTQTALASAPLCRSVLRSFTQEQINAAIEDFTRLTLQADSAQADGDSSTLTRSLLTSKRLKEKELMENLNISREELRKLVSARSADIRAKTELDSEAKQKQLAKEHSSLFKEFVLDRHVKLKSTFLSTSQFSLIDNVSNIYLRANDLKGYEMNKVLSLEDGSIKEAPYRLRALLSDSMLIEDTSKQWSVVNFKTGSTTKIEGISSYGGQKVAEDNKSVIVADGDWGKNARYLQIDQNGQILFATERKYGWLSIHHAGENAWLVGGAQGLFMFYPKTNKSELLGLGGSAHHLHGDKFLVQSKYSFTLLDIGTGQKTPVTIAGYPQHSVEVSHSDGNYVWLKYQVGFATKKYSIKKYSIDNFEEILGEPDYSGHELNIKHAKEAKLVSLWIDRHSEASGIYSEDLKTPVFKLSQKYDLKDFYIQNQVLSDDGKTLVIHGGTGSREFIDVWKLK